MGEQGDAGDGDGACTVSRRRHSHEQRCVPDGDRVGVGAQQRGQRTRIMCSCRAYIKGADYLLQDCTADFEWRLTTSISCVLQCPPSVPLMPGLREMQLGERGRASTWTVISGSAR